MTWARFDDRYDDNKKVKRAWKGHPRAVGLHAMATTYCARHETDGEVDLEWLEEKLPRAHERKKVLDALVGAGLFAPTPNGDGFLVNDYLDYNPSADELSVRREARARAGKKGAVSRWGDGK